MSEITDSSAGRGGTRHLLLRLARRVLALLAIFSWIAWIVGGFKTLMFEPPVPGNLSLSLRIDQQGLIFQKGPKWRQGPYIIFEEPNSRSWSSSLSDQEATWITPWIVVSSWQLFGSGYQLVGIRHVLLLSVSMVIFASLFRRVAIRKYELAAICGDESTQRGESEKLDE